MVTDWLRWPLHLLALAAVLLSEQDGLLVTRGRRGTFVAGPLPPPFSDAGRPNVARLDARRLDAAAEVFVAQTRRLGVDRRSAILAVNQALAAMPADRAR